MRIAHVIDYFQPQLGYQETYLALEQIKCGHTVRVFTSDRYRLFPDYEVSYRKFLGERIVGVGNTVECGINVTRLKVLFELFPRVWLKRFKKAIIEFVPDVIICHGVVSFSAYRLSRIKFSSRVKIIFDDHMLGITLETFRRRLMRYIYLIFFKRAVENSAYKIVGVTKVTLEFFEKKLLFNNEKTAHIPLGFAPEILHFSQQSREEIRLCFNILPSDIVGIYTGKINKNKGIPALVDALKYLFSKYDNFKFIFVGNGEQRLLAKIRREFSSDRVTIEDFVSQDYLCKYYSAADFGIWPEGISSSHIEALACKLPIIVSALPAAAERVAYNNGISLGRCDKVQIIKAIESLLNNKEIREEYSRNSLCYAQTISWKLINERLLAL